MRILFEDNPKSPVSRLLKHSPVKDKLLFTRGSKSLCTMARIFVENDEDVICYIDMVWNNPATEDSYAKLLRIKSMADNFILRRVPCTEFYVLLWLDMIKVYNFNKDIEILRFLYYGGDSISYYYKHSFEKFCKKILGETKRKCLHNKISEGLYYTQSCPCGYQYCSESNQLFFKALGLILMFPDISTVQDVSSVLNIYRIDTVEYPTEEDVYNRMWHALYDGGE